MVVLPFFFFLILNVWDLFTRLGSIPDISWYQSVGTITIATLSSTVESTLASLPYDSLYFTSCIEWRV